jgi:hypothetical protein
MDLLLNDRLLTEFEEFGAKGKRSATDFERLANQSAELTDASIKLAEAHVNLRKAEEHFNKVHERANNRKIMVQSIAEKW